MAAEKPVERVDLQSQSLASGHEPFAKKIHPHRDVQPGPGERNQKKIACISDIENQLPRIEKLHDADS